MGRRATRRRTRGFIDQAHESQGARRLRRCVIDDIDLPPHAYRMARFVRRISRGGVAERTIAAVLKLAAFDVSADRTTCTLKTAVVPRWGPVYATA